MNRDQKRILGLVALGSGVGALAVYGILSAVAAGGGGAGGGSNGGIPNTVNIEVKSVDIDTGAPVAAVATVSV